MMKYFPSLLLICLLSAQAQAADKDQQESGAITDTQGVAPAQSSRHAISTLDLLDMLVSAGVLSRQRADELLQQVLAGKSSFEIDKLKDNPHESAVDPRVVRVPYIPEFIKDQIRDEVRIGLREDVVGDVISQASHERWGVPDALPSWVNRISFSGDFRLRYQEDFFPEKNRDPNLAFSYLDFQAVNDAESVGVDPSFFLNRSEDRNRLRARLRLAMNAKVTEGIRVNARLATGKFDDPVSTNQTLGNSNNPYTLVLDRAYIEKKTTYNEMTLWGGRMPNPWLSTDLLWDSDLNFDGLAVQYRPLESDDMDDDERMFGAFVTLGAFPLDEVELSSDDKWLYGLQLGVSWKYLSQSRLDIGLAYYDYANITGKRNNLGSDLLDYTAPELMASGNTAFNIANDVDGNRTLLGLAADYNIVDFLVKYKYAAFAPYNLVVTADYLTNTGYDKDEVINRAGGVDGLWSNSDSLSNPEVAAGEPRVDGYMLKIDFGWPVVRLRDTWRVSLAYRHLERDAVLDIYTDSDFRGGGTDVEGWQISGDYAIDDNAWLTLKIISANEIDGPPFGQETIQLDMNASF
jgi:hypothetical protein